MRLFWVQWRKEWLELWQTRKAIIVLAVMLAFGFLAPITAKLLPELMKSAGNTGNITITIGEVTVNDAIDQFVKNTSQTIVILALLMSFNVIVSERERGLMTLIFPHALPRSTFVLAKFAALVSLFAVGMLLQAIAAYVYTALLFEAPTIGGFIVMTALLFLYLALIVALSLLASTIGKTTIMAVAIAFGFFVLLALVGVFIGFDPGELVAWGHAQAIHTEYPAQWGALATTLITIILAVAISCLALNRQEIE